jgi:integrase
MKRARVKGRVVWNKRYGTWNLLWADAEAKSRSRKLGDLLELPTREAALKKATTLGMELRFSTPTVPKVKDLIDRYRAEKMPERFSTRYGYESWIKNHILPRWGESLISDLQAREVEQWLKSLPLSQKSMVHIRGVIHQLWKFAMWERAVPAQMNPMELVTIKGATKRLRKPHNLTEDEFRKFIIRLEEPVRTIALMCVSFGLRISEALALKWSDVDWLNGMLRIQRGIVRQRVGSVKTDESERGMPIDPEMIAVLRGWKQTTQFFSETDWVFASPFRIGRLPVSYPWVWKSFRRASIDAGISQFGTHSLRHSYRSWLDAVGTPIAVQQKLMRHSDIRTTFNIYGDVVTNEMREAHSKVVRMALSRAI